MKITLVILSKSVRPIIFGGHTPKFFTWFTSTLHGDIDDFQVPFISSSRVPPFAGEPAVSFLGVSILIFQNVLLGGGFKHFLFSSLFGDMIQFDEHIFQMG